MAFTAASLLIVLARSGMSARAKKFERSATNFKTIDSMGYLLHEVYAKALEEYREQLPPDFS